MNEIANLRSLTENFRDMRGGLMIPAGLLLSVTGAKALFAVFDNNLVNNPSLFDRPVNIYWDIAVNSTIVFTLFLFIAIGYWYSRKFGRVIPNEKMRNSEILTGLTAFIATVLAIVFDSNLAAPFSFLGLVFCAIWILTFLKYPAVRKWQVGFFIIQAAALVGGPFLFSDLRPDLLEYMRRVVGLSMFTAGIQLFIAGIVMHSLLVQQLKSSRLNHTN